MSKEIDTLEDLSLDFVSLAAIEPAPKDFEDEVEQPKSNEHQQLRAAVHASVVNFKRLFDLLYNDERLNDTEKKRVYGELEIAYKAMDSARRVIFNALVFSQRNGNGNAI